MKKIIFFFAIFLSIQTLKAQLVSDSLRIGGVMRYFQFDKPVNAKNTSLVFVLHGSGGSGKDIRKSASKLEAKAETEKILLVFPDGYKRFWNECRKASNAAANLENIDENAFFQAMIDYFQQKYRINPNQVFAIGTSGGGHMAYKLALTMPDKFKAVSVIIANLPDSTNMDCTASGKPVPVMIINGTEDKTNPYNGGEVILGNNFSMGFVRSTDQTFRYWANLAGYSGEPAHEKLPDTDSKDGKTVEKYTFHKKGSPEVTLLKVIGGKHDYPNDIDVYLESWAFFKRQLRK